MIPKYKDENGEEPDLKKYSNHPFKRGVMKFEDYNYNMYNPYILIDNVKGAKIT